MEVLPSSQSGENKPTEFGEFLTAEFPLHRAAAGGCDEAIKYLIDEGYDVNTPNFDLMRPLHEACLNGHVSSVKLLISSGAEVNVRNIDGSTPLCDASCHGNVDIIKLLLENGADVNPVISTVTPPLHEAILRGHHDCAQMLIDAGSDVDVSDNHFGTPLHIAAYKGCRICAEILIGAGANVNVTKHHHSPLHDVARHNDVAFLSLMLEAGANQKYKNNRGFTAKDLLPLNSPARIFMDCWEVYPRSLMYWCRCAIRKAIGMKRLQCVEDLHLPRTLKAQLRMRLG